MKALLAHIHIPKCAGTAIRLTLDRVLGQSHLNLYFAHTTFILDEFDLVQFVASPEVIAFSSHFVRTFPQLLGDRPVHYITFLRDPIQQFISYLTYTKKQFPSLNDPILYKHLPPDMPERPIRECARWILDGEHAGFRNFRENYMTNFFARYVVLQRKGYGYGDRRYRRIRLAIAQEILAGFFFVGISERLNESWAALCQACTAVGINLPVLELPRENASSELRDNLSWINETDEVGSRLLESTREDRELYGAALERFERYIAMPEARLERKGPGLLKNLALRF